MTEFHNVRFPTSLAFGASGGPEFRTEINQLSNGREHRNTPHALPKRRYDAIAGIKSKAQIIELQHFFIARKGRLHSFRFLDPLDHSSSPAMEGPLATDQILGQGDGQRTDFQLVKTYDDGTNSLIRPITKPHVETVKIAIDGQLISSSNYNVDDLTGIVTFTSAPEIGVVISAGYEFDCVVRFDTDFLDITFEDFGAAQLRSLPMVELPYA